MKRVPLSDPRKWAKRPWRRQLDELWPEWRSYRSVPPLDDRDLRRYAAQGRIPAWTLDRLITARIFGGRGYRSTRRFKADTRVVVKPRNSVTGLALEGRVDETPCKVRRDEFVQPFYEGQQLSTDWALYDGYVLWGLMAEGYPYAIGRFMGWHVSNAAVPPTRDVRVGAMFLPRFRGIVNVETIGGNVSEVHFRPSVELFRLYGKRAVAALMDVANGRKVPSPKVRGGNVIVTPSGTRGVKPKKWGEISWREELFYT